MTDPEILRALLTAGIVFFLALFLGLLLALYSQGGPAVLVAFVGGFAAARLVRRVWR